MPTRDWSSHTHESSSLCFFFQLLPLSPVYSAATTRMPTTGVNHIQHLLCYIFHSTTRPTTGFEINHLQISQGLYQRYTNNVSVMIYHQSMACSVVSH